MFSGRTWVDAGRGLVFLVLYGAVTAALDSQLHRYVRVVAALTVSLGVIAVADVLPRLVRGERPLFSTDGRLYSVRGVVLLILIVLVTAVTIDWLRAATTLPESLVTLTGFVVGALVVLGPIAGYYWRHSTARPE